MLRRLHSQLFFHSKNTLSSLCSASSFPAFFRPLAALYPRLTLLETCFFHKIPKEKKFSSTKHNKTYNCKTMDQRNKIATTELLNSSSSSSLLLDSTIIALNNQGAAFLTSGDLQNALPMLSQALTYSKHYMSQHIQGPNQASFNISTLMVDALDDENEDDGDEDMGNQSSSSYGSSFSSRCYIYLNPIVIPDSTDLTINGAHGETVLSSIVIFNVALCHHSLALQQLHQQQQSQTQTTTIETRLLLLKAMKLYELAIKLHQGSVSALGLHCSKLYILSCLNNLGNVHQLLGDAVASDACFQRLLSILMYLSYTRKLSDFESTLNYTPFFKNLFHHDRRAAPAA